MSAGPALQWEVMVQVQAREQLGERAANAERTGQWGEADELYGVLFRRGIHDGSVRDLVDALRGGSRVRRQEARYDEAIELAELSWTIASLNDLPKEAARALNEVAVIRYVQQDWGGARALYESALNLAFDVGDDVLIGWTCLNLGVIANILGNLREARSLYLESIGSSVRSGNESSAMMAYNNLGIVCSDLGEWMEAELYLGRGIEIAERLGNTPLLAKLYVNRAKPLIEIGDLPQAHEVLVQAENLGERTKDVVVLTEALRYRGVLARKRRDFSAAEEYLLRSHTQASTAGLTLEQAEALEEIARLRYMEGRPEVAARVLGEAREAFLTVGAEGNAARVEQLLRCWTTPEQAAPAPHPR